MDNKKLTRSIEMTMSALIMYWKNYFETNMKKYSIKTVTMGAVLYSAYKHEGVVQDDICKMLNMDKAYVTRELNSLARLGYIVREKDNDDHRKNHIYVTKSGVEVAKTIEKVRNRWSAIEYENFSEEDKKNFLSLINKMHNNIKAHI